MNFCQKIDLYISLYIDNKLEAEAEESFLKHIGECPECADKLEQESLFTDLCRHDEPVALPENFKAALHSKLLDVAQEEQKAPNTRLLFNRKYMTAVSSAAVVVISLLAYNLLPGSGVFDNKSIAGSSNESLVSGAVVSGGDSETALKFNESIAGGEAQADSSSSPEIQKAPEGGNVTAEQAAQSSEENAPVMKNEASGDMGMADRKASLFGSASQAESTEAIKAKFDRVRKQAEVPEKSPAAAAGGNASSRDKQQDQKQLKSEMASILAADTGIHYYTSYVELELIFSHADTGIKELDILMNEKGAILLGSGMVNGFEANTAGTAQYVDYSVPLSAYAALRSEALLKYNMEFKAKTDIIKTDVTMEYNNLENEKIDMENKIKEALKNGKDTSALESEKSVLLKQMEAIIANNDSMTVRIFLVNK